MWIAKLQMQNYKQLRYEKIPEKLESEFATMKNLDQPNNLQLYVEKTCSGIAP